MTTTHIDRRQDSSDERRERFDTIVIGGGQAGLTAGYHLKRRGLPFVILDTHERIGDAWRTRWDSLRLFTPASHSGLPGWRFPAPGFSFATKDEMADYLEAYAARFELTVRNGVTVDRLSKSGERFVVEAGESVYEADHVIVATGAHQTPSVPEFARELDPRILQLHSSEYRSPTRLRDGDVLLVGAGNSGAEIAYELSTSRHAWLAGPDVGQIPVPHGSRRSRVVFPLVFFMFHQVLTKGNPIGRKVGPERAAGGSPLIRRRQGDLEAAGVERVPRVVGVRDGLPLLEDDRVLEPANIVWCTGFRQDFSWIDLPLFGEDGLPEHERGVVRAEPGLYFLGLVFQYSISSDVLPNRGRDARYIARHLTGLGARRSR
jgi:putative flavoprotein involved in K+ transport